MSFITFKTLLNKPLKTSYVRFNYRATHHMVENGFYNFLNWFDSRAWYPLGRIVGGTVSAHIIYGGGGPGVELLCTNDRSR